jgi:hypothetical protein
VIEPHLPFLLPWVRVALLIRTIRTTIWDDATWPTVKMNLARALRMRQQMNRGGLVELDQIRGRLRAVLAAVLVDADGPELALVHRWLDSWRGVGLLAVGLHRTGYDLDLRQYGDGHWQASFYVTGLAHSILGGSAWEPTVWRAVQRAAWDALKHAERNL